MMTIPPRAVCLERRRCRDVLVTAAIAAVLVGCGSDGDEAGADDLVGTWQTPDGLTWEVTEDSIGYSDGGSVLVESTYTATDSTLEMTNETGPLACPPNQPGEYEWEINDDMLSLTVIGDDCDGRVETIDGIVFERVE